MNKLEAKLDTKSQDITEWTHDEVREVREEYAEVRDKVARIDADLIVLRNQMTQIDKWPAR
jgi:DNA repair exonuclease SbcCD ATPase subunit